MAEWSNSRRTGTFAVMEQEMTETQAEIQEQNIASTDVPSASTASSSQPVVSQSGVVDLGSMPLA